MWSVCRKRDLGTIGTVRTMVPAVGGSRAPRDPPDQSWTIISMSRATPEEKLGVASNWDTWLHAIAGVRVFRAPDIAGPWSRPVPMVPRRDSRFVPGLGLPSDEARADSDHAAAQAPTRLGPSRVVVPDSGNHFAGFGTAPRCGRAGRLALSRPDRERATSLRQSQCVGAASAAPHPVDPRLRELQFDHAAASTQCGRHGAIFQPVVCPAALPARSVPWFPSWFHASGSSASRRPLGAKPSARADRSGGNNCWRFSPVFSFCF
jgi:hypothetical protein